MGNSVVQKDVLAKYVNDAVEMESAIFTLGEMEKECEKEKQLIINEAESKLRKAEWKLSESKCEPTVEIIEPPKAPSHDSDYLAGCQMGCGGGVIIALAVTIVFWIINVIMGNEKDSVFYASVFGITFCIVSIIISILFGRLFSWSTKDDYKKALEKYNEDCKLHAENRRKVISQCEAKVVNAQRNLQNAKEETQLIDLQIREIRKKRAQLQSNLIEFYNYGIVPPSYRNFDCVMMLDEIFCNDLADTMREAIKIYDERVFRGSVIRGMDRICSMLGRLSSEMSAISLRLDMINSSVAQMGDDLSKANQKLMNNQRELIEQSIKNRAATEELINETKLGRYTNEKLLESNQVLAKYANDKRLGII